MFKSLLYLQEGTPRQRAAYLVLTQHGVMDKLSPFTPILVGTIPINIDIETSDLDIICYWTDREEFYTVVQTNFDQEREFTIRESVISEREVVVANFRLGDFDVEIFGQNIPTQQQNAYRHMLIEHRLLLERGEDFRQAIIALKQQGLKTEPAFGKLLGLQGNPYDELLIFENSAINTV
ncbi:DUF4269 domain-containing protein [Spirosoma daeguense]